MKKYNLGFLASHNGTNMQSIIDACKNGTLSMNPAVVISNNEDSGALVRAKSEGIPSYHLSSIQYPNVDDLDHEIMNTLVKHNVDVVILAGYMKMIGPKVLERFKGRILNIHPALLPKYGGKGMYGINVHKAVLDNHEKETGVTIHLVDPLYDHGKILSQSKIKVLENDTPESLSERVLKIEHKLFVDTLIKISKEDIPLSL